MFARVAFTSLLLLALGSPAPAEDRLVTLSSLLVEMTDVQNVARFPDPAFTARQASSYDRASKTPDDPKGWFANHDWSQFIRSETNAGRLEWVMMEADGPGAVVRIWFGGNKPPGTLRFYLDGAAQPAIEGPAFDILIGRLLADRPLAIENAHGAGGIPAG